MDFTQFSSLVKKAFNWIVTSWKHILISSTMIFFWKASCEEKATGSHEHLPENSDHEDLKQKLRKLQEMSSLTLERFNEVEEEMKQLKSDLSIEKALWSNRYYELLQEQNQLKHKLKCAADNEEENSTLYYTTNTKADATDEEVPPLNVGQDTFHWRTGAHVNSSEQSCQEVTSLDHWHQQDVSSLQGGQSFPPADHWSQSDGQSSRGWQNPPSFRVFVPRSHLNLRFGHRVKILLASGTVGNGVVRYLGHLPERVEVYVGVDLEIPEQEQCDGVFAGHNYFHCEPGHGVFVPFNKVLLAWELPRTKDKVTCCVGRKRHHL